MTIEISVFSSSSYEGKLLEKMLIDDSEIKKQLKSLLNQKGSLNIDVNTNFIQSDAIEYEFHRVVLYSDVVIFDGSLEEDGISLGNNYACIPHAPYLMDNVIVVSRTELPINFIPNAYQTNVTPIGEESEDERKQNSKKKYSNEEIVEWLKGCLMTMVEEERLPRKPEYKVAKELLTDGNVICDYFNKVYSLTERYKKNRYKNTAFISYRSYYGEHESNGYSVETLKEYILAYHRKNTPNEKWKVMYYTSGSLAQDCLTEYRRWSLMEYVNYIFTQVDEVWIFNTHDTVYGPSYWDSWFTQGEFISLMNLKNYLPHCCPKILMFDSSTGTVDELVYLPKITKSIKHELSITTANSDIVYGDISAYKNMCMLKQNWHNLPMWIRIKLRFYYFKNFKVNIKKQFASHSYDRDFLTNRIFSCPDCLKKGNNIDSFRSKNFIWDFLNIYSSDSKIQEYNNKRGYFFLTDEDFKDALKSGIITCPNCGKKFKISESNKCFYIWERNILHINEEHKYIEKVKAYNIE